MDRLVHRKTSKLNHNSSSELDYETANEDNQMPLYDSINNNSLDKIIQPSTEQIKQTDLVKSEDSVLCKFSLVGLNNSLIVPYHETDPKSPIKFNGNYVKPISNSGLVPIVSSECTNSSEHTLSDVLTPNGIIEDKNSRLHLPTSVDTVVNVEKKIDMNCLLKASNLFLSSETLHQNQFLPMEIKDDISETTVEEPPNLKVEATSMTSQQNHPLPKQANRLDVDDKSFTDGDESMSDFDSDEEWVQPDSPMKNAIQVPFDEGPHTKPRYKNDRYLDEVRVLFLENPPEDDTACFYVTIAMMVYGYFDIHRIKKLRSMFEKLLNYERLLTAQAPELSMERFAMISTNNDNVKILPKEMVENWNDLTKAGGATRVFNYLLSYLLNDKVIVLDTSNSLWREYDMSNQDGKLSPIQKEFQLEMDPLGPPYIIAEHIEIIEGERMGTHVALAIHENHNRGFRTALPYDIYIKFLSHPKMVELYPFSLAKREKPEDSSNHLSTQQ